MIGLIVACLVEIDQSSRRWVLGSWLREVQNDLRNDAPHVPFFRTTHVMPKSEQLQQHFHHHYWHHQSANPTGCGEECGRRSRGEGVKGVTEQCTCTFYSIHSCITFWLEKATATKPFISLTRLSLHSTSRAKIEIVGPNNSFLLDYRYWIG